MTYALAKPRSPYFLREPEPIAPKFDMKAATQCSLKELPPDDAEIRLIVKRFMERVFLRLKTNEDEDEGIRFVTNLCLELIRQDCVSVLYGEEPKHFPNYVEVYSQLAHETYELWRQCGRLEDGTAWFQK